MIKIKKVLRNIFRFKVFFLLLILLASYVNAQKKLFIISGSIKGLKETDSIYLVLNNDTIRTKIKNENFQLYSSQYKLGEFCFLHLNNHDRFLTLIADDTSIKIEATKTDWPVVSISGSSTNTEYLSFSKNARSISERMCQLQEKRSLAYIELDTNTINFLTVEINKKLDTLFKLRVNFIKNHPNSIYTPFLIMTTSKFNCITKQEEYDNLSLKARGSYFGVLLKEDIEFSKKREQVKIGSVIPDFSSKTIDGKNMTLYQIIRANSYTLIDFWASWCKPCRQEVPNLKRVYDKYYQYGFNILSVSLDASENLWKKAINEEDMNWHHVSQLKGGDEDAARLFGINGIPAALLVDSKGKILAIDAPGAKIESNGGDLRGEALFKKINDLINPDVKE